MKRKLKKPQAKSCTLADITPEDLPPGTTFEVFNGAKWHGRSITPDGRVACDDGVMMGKVATYLKENTVPAVRNLLCRDRTPCLQSPRSPAS